MFLQVELVFGVRPSISLSFTYQIFIKHSLFGSITVLVFKSTVTNEVSAVTVFTKRVTSI